ncbi:MAG: hypothetical protein P1U52_12440 [Porticoccaceae bacterium]|nr:hypothetical protein [Porticoccaceae bacterium]
MPLLTYSFPRFSLATSHELPAIFPNTLPDDFSNVIINAWVTPFECLLYTSERDMSTPAIEVGKSGKEGGGLALD